MKLFSSSSRTFDQLLNKSPDLDLCFSLFCCCALFSTAQVFFYHASALLFIWSFILNCCCVISHFPSFVVPVFHQKFQQLVESFVSVHSILLSCLLSPSSLCVALIRLHLLNYPLELIKQFRQPVPTIRLCSFQFPYLGFSFEHTMLACILSLKSSTFRFVNLVCVCRAFISICSGIFLHAPSTSCLHSISPL